MSNSSDIKKSVETATILPHLSMIEETADTQDSKRQTSLSKSIESAERNLSDELSDTQKALKNNKAVNEKLLKEVANGKISIAELENELERYRNGARETLNINKVQIHVAHNRSRGYFELSQSTENWLRTQLTNLRSGNIDTISDPIDNEFAMRIVSIYLTKGNETPVSYRDVDGTIQLIFGETRFRSVKWLIDNGFNEYQGDSVQLYGYELHIGDSECNFLASRFRENNDRTDLCEVDRLIQLSQLFESFKDEFSSGRVEKSRNQKAEGWAYSRLSMLTGKSRDSLRKSLTYSHELGLLSNILGTHTLYLNTTSIKEIYLRTNAKDAKLSMKGLAKKLRSFLDEAVLNNGIDYDSPELSSADKKRIINRECTNYLKSTFPLQDSQKGNIPTTDYSGIDEESASILTALESSHPQLHEQLGNSPKERALALNALKSQLTQHVGHPSNTRTETPKQENRTKKSAKTVLTEEITSSQGVKVIFHFNADNEIHKKLQEKIEVKSTFFEDEITDLLNS